jgi:hypothetical protein
LRFRIYEEDAGNGLSSSLLIALVALFANKHYYTVEKEPGISIRSSILPEASYSWAHPTLAQI